MPENVAHSSNDSPELEQVRFFVPTVSEAFLYLIIGSLYLLAYNARQIWHYFTFSVLSLSSGINLANSGSSWWDGLVRIATTSRLPLILFWFIVGLLIYVTIWFFRNLYLNLRNDFVVDSYVHPKNFNRGKFWEVSLARKLLFALSVLVLIAYIIWFVKLLDELSREGYSLVTNYHTPKNLLFLFFTALTAGFLIYLLVLLIRTVGRCWRFINSDF